jgi:hypothetical protein
MEKRLKSFNLEQKNENKFLTIHWETRTSDVEPWVPEEKIIKLSGLDTSKLLSLKMRDLFSEESTFLEILFRVSKIASKEASTNSIPLRIKLLDSISGDVIKSPSVKVFSSTEQTQEELIFEDLELDKDGFFTISIPLNFSNKMIFSAENYVDLKSEIGLLTSGSFTLRMSSLREYS